MTFGPYETEADTWGTPLYQAERRLHDEGKVTVGDPDRLVRDLLLRHLTETCEQTGVEVGAYKRSVLDGLALGLTPHVQVIAGLIQRAHEASRAAHAQVPR